MVKVGDLFIYAAGDIVSFKAGGPLMTVMFASGDGQEIQVGWMNVNRELQLAKVSPMAVKLFGTKALENLSPELIEKPA